MRSHFVSMVAVCLVSFVARVNALSQGGPAVGGKPPDVSSLKLLQAPANARTDWTKLKGKVVVLEFWATWCGPCVAAINHMNELTDKFKDKQVQFVAITDEDEADVTKFLKKRPIHGWVGLDADKSVHKAFAVNGIPHTVLVDQKGNIADITYPLSLTEQRINDLLAGRKLLAAEKRREGYRAGEFPQSMSQGKLPLFQILIRPSESTNHQSTGGGGALTALDFTLEELLTTIYPFTASRIITNSPLPLERFDVVASVPDRNDETRNNMLKQAFGAAFGIHAVVETREVPVYLLTQKSGSARGLVPAATDSFAAALGPGKISGVGLPIALLCQGLEKGLGKPVVDETGLKGKFDIELKWDQHEPDHLNPQALMDAVRERLGLELSPAQRPVEVLVIDRTPPKEK